MFSPLALSLIFMIKGKNILVVISIMFLFLMTFATVYVVTPKVSYSFSMDQNDQSNTSDSVPNNLQEEEIKENKLHHSFDFSEKEEIKDIIIHSEFRETYQNSFNPETKNPPPEFV